MTKEFKVSQLGTALMWWLSYTTSVGRDYVLSESSIKLPLAEYLERSNVTGIVLEYGHPKLSKRRFDLFFQTKDTKSNKQNNAFEFKYIKNSSTIKSDEKQRIFDDLLRLHLYLENDNNSYFLICGDQYEFSTNFQNIPTPKNSASNNYITPKTINSVVQLNQSNGFYTEWFSFDISNPDKKIDLQNQNTEYKSIYDGFVSDYSNAYNKKTGLTLQLPKSITTQLVFLTQSNQHTTGISEPSKIGIWKVIV